MKAFSKISNKVLKALEKIMSRGSIELLKILFLLVSFTAVFFMAIDFYGDGIKIAKDMFYHLAAFVCLYGALDIYTEMGKEEANVKPLCIFYICSSVLLLMIPKALSLLSLQF